MTLPGTRRRVAIWMGVFLLLAVAAVAFALTPQSSGAKPKDTADFRYEVIKFDYKLKAVTGASRESTTCVAGVTQDIGGAVTTAPADLGPLTLGDGTLSIENDGTRGIIDARDDFDFNFKGSQRLTTLCEGGTTAMSSSKECVETMTSGVSGFGLIKGPVGDAVRITWQFNQSDFPGGGWSPTFFCNEAVAFESKEKCRSDSYSLHKMTSRTVRLPFRCDVKLKTTPPAGTGYDRYEAFATLSGSVKLRTEKDDR